MRTFDFNKSEAWGGRPVARRVAVEGTTVADGGRVVLLDPLYRVEECG